MSTQGRIYGGVSAAERQADRRQRFLEAGLDLLGEHGVTDVTVGDVCARAALSKRYFYEEFRSLGALAEVILDNAVDHLTETVFGPRADRDGDLPRDRIAAFVNALAADARLARLILVETLGGGALAARRNELVHRSVELLLQDFLSPASSGMTADTPRHMAAYALSGATSELLVAWVDGDFEATPDDVVDFLVSLFANAAGAAAGRSGNL